MADRFVPPVLTALDDDGDPLSGAKLYFYDSGTTTAKNTYSNVGLVTANANPVVADSAGRFGDIFLSSGAYKVILKTSGDTTIWTRDPTPGTSAEGQEWLALGDTPNFSSTTQFTISGDVTTSYHVNRRVKFTDASTLYGTITVTSYSDPNTTITVSLDSGNLTSALSAVSVGLISATPRSLPAAFAIDMDGTEIILDGDGDTSITADADDVIDFKIGGGDAILFGHGTGNTVGYLHVDPTAFTTTANTNFGIIRVGNTNAATVPSGTTAIAAGLYLEIPNWTATGTITASAALYVEGAATEGSTDYAVWVDAGDTRLDGDLDVAAAATSIKILDNSATALVIKEASTAYMSFITTNSGEKVEMGKALDMNGQELILDANANTSITADTDDQIDIKIAGADDFQFTANTFTALSGSTISIASGATIANSGTATGFGAAEANTVTKTSAYTVVAGDDNKTILASAASANYELALTAAATLGDGWTCTIKKSDASKFMVTVNPSGSESIDGLPDLKLRHEHSSVTLICDGSNFHIRHHSNIAIEYNMVENANMQVQQYGHVTATGLGASTAHFTDRWQAEVVGSASARWTYSKETNGGVHGKSAWTKFLNTTADASPGSGEAQYIRQSILGNNGVDAGFLGSDGFFENGVFYLDMIVALATPDAPYTVTLAFHTLDGTARQYGTTVSILADATWQRVGISIPEDGTARFDAGTSAGRYISVGLYAGSGQVMTDATWENNANESFVSGSENLAGATGNYLGITNCKFQPGQIATSYLPRMYEEELDICKYYFEKRINSNTYSPLANAFTRTTTIAAGFYGYSEKRATPTIAFSGATEFGVTNGASSDIQTTGVTAEDIHPTGCRLKFTVGSGLTAGDGVQLANWNNTTAYITVSAEI